jgi:hypothetical protein
MQTKGNKIADALDRLHPPAWSVGDTAFHDVECGGFVHVVIGSNGRTGSAPRARQAPKTDLRGRWVWRAAVHPGREAGPGVGCSAGSNGPGREGRSPWCRVVPI